MQYVFNSLVIKDFKSKAKAKTFFKAKDTIYFKANFKDKP